ncbi:hypothetical protein M3231_05830 [Neobacillus mesonae]|nr:hypothetical protein [Neobacillus mesonae]
MIVLLIAFCFLLIGWYEHGYMNRKKRSLRAKRLMWITLLLFLVLTEVAYLTREQMSIAMIVRYIFYDIQQAIFLQ